MYVALLHSRPEIIKVIFDNDQVITTKTNLRCTMAGREKGRDAVTVVKNTAA